LYESKGPHGILIF